jgi:acyl-CoA thioester hydrolase
MQEINFDKYKHKIELNVRFMDLDAMHHVNNARYLNFLEESRIAYSQEILQLFNDVKTFNAVVARIEIDYLRPIQFGEKVFVYTRVSKIGTKSFHFESVIAIDKNGKNVAVAVATQALVNIDIKSGKSEAIPEDIRKKIEQFEA